MMRRSSFRPFIEKEEVRPITRSPSTWASALRISSAIPSEKYSCSLSELRLTNGSTAMEGMAGAAGTAPGASAARRPAPGQTKK
jgi:hypothetical protein